MSNKICKVFQSWFVPLITILQKKSSKIKITYTSRSLKRARNDPINPLLHIFKNKKYCTFAYLTGRQIGEPKYFLFYYFSFKIYVVGTQKNRLYETVLLNTQNKWFIRWIRKYPQFYVQFFVYPDLCLIHFYPWSSSFNDVAFNCIANYQLKLQQSIKIWCEDEIKLSLEGELRVKIH